MERLRKSDLKVTQDGSKGVAHNADILPLLVQLSQNTPQTVSPVRNVMITYGRILFPLDPPNAEVRSDESLPLPVRSAWNPDCAQTSIHPSKPPEKVQTKLLLVDGFAGNSNPLKENGWTTSDKWHLLKCSVFTGCNKLCAITKSWGTRTIASTGMTQNSFKN